MARKVKPKLVAIKKKGPGALTPEPSTPEAIEKPRELMAAAVPLRFNRGPDRGRSVAEVFSEGNRLLRMGRYDKAAQRYRRAIQLGGELSEAYHNLAIACYRQRFFVEARRAIERSLELEPKSALYHQTAAILARDVGEGERALEYLGQAIELEPSSAAVLYIRGRLLHDMGRLKEADRDLSRAIELDKGNSDLSMAAAAAAMDVGEHDRAKRLIDAVIAESPGNPEPYHSLGQIHHRLGNFEESRRHLARAVELGPNVPKIALAYAEALARHRDQEDNREQAIQVLRSCLEANEGQEFDIGKELAPLHFLLASLYDDTKAGYDLAMESYRAGLEWNPDHEVAHNNLGALFLAANQVDSAVHHFQRALAIRPSYQAACFNFAKVLFHHGTASELEERFTGLLEATRDQAFSSLAIITLALVNLAENETYAEIHERNHRIKNVLALAGNKVKRTGKRLGDTLESETLGDVVTVLQETYESLGRYLKAIRPQASAMEWVDVNRIVEKVARRMERSRPEKCQIEFHTQLGIPQVQGEAARLEEAVLNLAQNSLEALGDREGRITLTTAWHRESGIAQIQVEDTGPGISAGVREKIFRSGYTTKPSGNGLGLSSVKRAVSALQGSVEVESDKGGGTRFIIKLPLDAETGPRGGGLSMADPHLEDPGNLIVEELA